MTGSQYTEAGTNSVSTAKRLSSCMARLKYWAFGEERLSKQLKLKSCTTHGGNSANEQLQQKEYTKNISRYKGLLHITDAVDITAVAKGLKLCYTWSGVARAYFACPEVLSASYQVTSLCFKLAETFLCCSAVGRSLSPSSSALGTDTGLVQPGHRVTGAKLPGTAEPKGWAKALSQAGAHSAAQGTAAFVQEHSLDTSVDTVRQRHGVMWYAVTIKVGCDRYIWKI